MVCSFTHHSYTSWFVFFYTIFSKKAMAPHSSTLAWKISRMEEPGGLQSMGSLRVGHDWATSLSLSCIGEGNGNPLQCSCLENPRDGGAWWAAVYGVAQSRTQLKWLSSSSSSRGDWAIRGPTWIWRYWSHSWDQVLQVPKGLLCWHLLPRSLSSTTVQPEVPRLFRLQACDTSPGHQGLRGTPFVLSLCSL